ncbi:MAG TPA: hypothetical protein PLD27_01675 [bacterium]|nr:hypothetical protein [bacterium]HPQ18435.1 hypothetical protein [bacterium]
MVLNLNHKNISIICFTFFIFLVFMLPYLISGKILWEGDAADIFLPNIFFIKQQLKLNNLPEWNPYIQGGIPYSNYPTSQTLYILYYFFIFLPPHHQIMWFQICHIILTFIGFFKLYNYLGCSFFSAIIGSILFVTSHYYTAQVGLLDIIATITYLPWILLYLFKWLDNNKLKFSYILGILSGFQFLAGHPQFWFYTLLLCLIILLFNLKKFFSKKIKFILFSFFIFILVFTFTSAPLLFTFYNFVLQSERNFIYLSNENYFGFKILNLLNIIIPHFTGYGDASLKNLWLPLKKYYYVPNSDYIEYIPIFSLILFLFFLKEKNVYKKFFLTIIFIGFVFSFYNAFLPKNFYKLLPVFKLFRYYDRIYLFIIFAISFISALMFDKIFNQEIIINSKTIIVILFFILLIGLIIFSFKNFHFLFQRFYTQLNNDAIFRLNLFLKNVWKNYLFVLLNLFSFFIAIIIFNFTFKKYILIIFFIFYVIINFMFYPLRTISKIDLIKYFNELTFLKNVAELKPFEYINFENQIETRYIGARGMIKNIFIFGGEHLKLTYRLSNFLNKNRLDEIYSIKYQLLENKKNNDDKEIFLNGKKYFLHKNLNYKEPITYISNDKVKNYFITLLNSDEIKIELESEIDSEIIFRINYYPGWTIKVNSIKQNIKLFDNNFFIINVKQGKNIIHLLYKDLLNRFGLFLFFSFIIGNLIYFIFLAKLSKKNLFN